MNFCSGVLSPKSMNLLAKVRYDLAKVIPFGKTSNDLAKPLYNLAKPGSFTKLYRVLLNSTKESHIYGGRYYGAADRCMADLRQSGKPIGAGLSVDYLFRKIGECCSIGEYSSILQRSLFMLN